MDDIRSVDPAFVPANVAVAFGPALTGVLWRGAALCNSKFSSESRRGTVLKQATRTVAIIAALPILSAGAASAAELKVFSGGAMRAAVQELAGTFEASSGHTLVPKLPRRSWAAIRLMLRFWRGRFSISL